MACKDYNGDYIEALDAGTMAVRDAALCPWQMNVGGLVFATIVLVGMVNVPIYIRQESLLVPTIITLIAGGLFVTQMAGMAQAIVGLVILTLVSLGPVLMIRRIRS